MLVWIKKQDSHFPVRISLRQEDPIHTHKEEGAYREVETVMIFPSDIFP